MPNSFLLVRIWTLALGGTLVAAAVGAGGDYLGPSAMVASNDATTLYVANADARQIVRVDLRRQTVTRRIGLPAEPSGLVLSPDGTKLIVTCAAPQSTVLVLDTASGEPVATIRAGHTAMGPAVTPDGKRLYVCNRFTHDVSVIDLAARSEVARVAVVREPLAAAVTPDGNSVLVINHLPADRADGYDVAAAVTAIDTQTNRAAGIRLLNGSSGLRGIAVSPDGKYAYVTHLLCRYELPTTQVEHGWMNTNAVSVIDVEKKRLLNTVLLDERDLGAANPWAVALTADGKSICVTHAGSHELSVIDARALLEKLLTMPTRAERGRAEDPNLYDDRTELLDYLRRRRAALLAGHGGYGSIDRDLYTAGTAAGVPNELAFLAGLRRRIRLRGKGARGLAVVGSKAYVAQHFTDSLDVIDLEADDDDSVTTIALGPVPQWTVRRRGEMLFHDGELCYQHWQSCASCHPDGRVDGLNWDLLNDGQGNPKNTKSMLLAHRTPPAMISGTRASAEAAVRAGIRHIQFTVRPEAEAAAIDEYLKSLEPVPSPHLAGGRLSPAARRGGRLFESDEVGCHTCHPPPLYTDLATYDVGTKAPLDRCADFDTPALIEVWRTAPYLHDGRYATIRELITKGKHGNSSGRIDRLTEEQVDDLVEFVLSL